MVGVFSQLERAMIRARLRAGRKHKAHQGGYAGGAPRFGYKAVDKELVPDPDEQAAIKRAWQLRDEEPEPPAEVIALEENGSTTKRGGRWHPYAVARLLDEEKAHG